MSLVEPMMNLCLKNPELHKSISSVLIIDIYIFKRFHFKLLARLLISDE